MPIHPDAGAVADHDRGQARQLAEAGGRQVAAGDVIAEIETDKATMEVEAVDEGKLGKILVPRAPRVSPSTHPIALLLEEGEDASALEGFDRAAAMLPQPAPRRRPERSPSAERKPPRGDAEPPAEPGGNRA
jgi:pyruvate/2-oxoglutarate dehydrogenase complex dihydrolipoamide acyltransferase (E2) component